MIVHERHLPPTLDERKARFRARVRRLLHLVCLACVPVAFTTAPLGLWLLTRLQFGWGVTLVCLAGIAAVGAVSAVTDVGPKDTPR